MTTLIGSVSHGTMNPKDLIPCFMDLLDELKEKWAIAPRGQEAEYTREFTRIDDNLAKIEQARKKFENEDDYYSSNDAGETLEFLFEEIEKFAPPYFYFGAHPGDGSDYGFWLSESMVEDFDGLKVNDTSEVPSDYEGEVLHVNDHGNCTLYTADGRGNLTEVWAIV